MNQWVADFSGARGVARARYKIHLVEAVDAFMGVRREWACR